MKRVASRHGAAAGLLLIASAAVWGCGGKPAAGPGVAATAGSPRDAVIQLTEAMHEGDEARLMALLEGTDKQKEYMRIRMDFITAGKEFREAFIKAYGRQAWEDFQDESKAPIDGNATLSVSDPEEKIARFREAEIDERGEEAFCENTDTPGEKIRLIRVEDGWRVDADSLCPDDEKMQGTIKQLGPLAKVIRKYMKAIGHEGIGPEDIDAELGREITTIMTGMELPGPHRFDIDKL